MTNPLLGIFGIGITELIVLGLCLMVPVGVACLVLVIIGIAKSQDRNRE